MNNFKKAFTLIELLIVIAIIGILSAIVFVSYPGILDSAKDTGVKYNLRTIASLNASVINENLKPGAIVKGLCENDQVQRAFDSIFASSTSGVLTTLTNQKFYTEATIIVSGTRDIKNGCVSNLSNWVIWSDLPELTGKAWCIDSGGFNNEIDTNDNETDVYKIVIGSGGIAEETCAHLEKNA